MFVCQAKLPWEASKTLAKMEPHVYATLRRRVPQLELPENQAEVTKQPFYKEFLMNDAEVAAVEEAGLEVQCSRFRGLASNSRDVHQTVYQISVANVGLMQIQRVEVLEDCCTHELQTWLDRGWRILAVCPPNDARRPAYVMGHFEKDA